MDVRVSQFLHLGHSCFGGSLFDITDVIEVGMVHTLGGKRGGEGRGGEGRGGEGGGERQGRRRPPPKTFLGFRA